MLGPHVQFTPKAIAPGPQETNSPLFASLLEWMGRKPHLSILDLGPARAANLEMLSRFSCKLFIEDAHELIAAFTNDAIADRTVLDGWLGQWSAGGTGSLDVVLAWDIFNYLDPALCRSFMERLTPLLASGAHLYLTVYSQKDMPALPMQFTLLAADRMAYRPLSHATRPSPRFNQTELIRRLRDFTVVKSVLLRNGMQEYLLKLSA
jgi:hypothetical protein